MSGRDLVHDELNRGVAGPDGTRLEGSPIHQATAASQADPVPITGALIGELIAITDDGRTPLVLYPGQQGTAALSALSVVDLHGAHIGRQVVLMFESGNPRRPVIMGVLRRADGWPLEKRPGAVEV